MQKHLTILAVSLWLGATALPAIAQDAAGPDANTVVATVNGQDITIGHMIAARATLPERFNEVDAQQLYDGILEQIVQQTALAQTLETLPPLAARSLENEERSLKAATVIERALENAVTEEDIQAVYDERFASAEQKEEYNAAHILVETEEEAQAIKAELDAGASFAATAREKSTGPSGPNGGDLGWFGTGMMVPSFEAAVIALEVGAVSDPVQTQFGWHVIQLNEIRKEEVPTLEATRDQIVAELSNAAALEIISNAANDADVTVPVIEGLDPAILTQRELLEE